MKSWCLKWKEDFFLVGGGLSCLFYLLLVIEVEPVLKDTVRRVAERTERRFLLEWGGALHAHSFHEMEPFWSVVNSCHSPGSPTAPGEAFERNARSGLLEHLTAFCISSYPWQQGEFPGMVPVNEFNASETLVKRDLCHVWVNCLLLSLSPDLTNKEKVQ